VAEQADAQDLKSCGR